ncbi:MAG: major facilitator superfamily transporter [Bacteroidetes bacterium HLUCCA01]|nr:MAG: major facilitator superfamily transporter [Bacteroidetes bacterium HLUCCA01]
MKNIRLFTVFLVVLVDLIGFGIVLPLMPFYASEFGASPVMIGLLYSIYSVAQLIFSPIWGGWSDRIGRRPIMLLSTLGAAAAYILFGLAETFTLLLLSRLLAGVMGGNISTAQAYIADVTSPEDRARGMGLIGAAFGLGFVTGPVLATALIHPVIPEWFAAAGLDSFSAWIQTHTYALPAFFAAVLSFLSFLLVYFKLEETVVDGAEVAKGAKDGVFTRKYWKTLADTSSGSTAGKVLVLLMVSMFVLSFGQSSLYSAFPLYCEAVLNMDAGQVGIQFFWLGIITAVVQGGLIKPLTKVFREETLFLTGNILMATGLFLLGTATTTPQLTSYLALMAVGHSLNLPTITSLISQKADPRRMGTTIGATQGLSGLGRAIGPTWGGALFGLNVSIPFFFTGMVVLFTVWSAIVVRRDNRSGPVKP